MRGSEDKGEQLNLDRAELRAVAKRPAEGSFKNFFLDMKSLLSVRALKAAVVEFQRDDALGLAAQLAFYLILALFPFLLVLVSLMGTFSSPELAGEVLGYFREVTPDQVYGIVESYLSDIIAGNRPAPGLFSVGLVLTLWSASGAFAALIAALNKAYDVEETRPFWKVRGIALLMTLGLSVMIIIGVLLLVAGPPIGRGIADLFGLGEVFTLIWNVVQWPVALSLMVFTVALLYYFAPDAERPYRGAPLGAGERDLPLLRLQFRLLRRDLRLHRRRHRPAPLPLYLFSNHPLRRRAKRYPRTFERRDLRRTDP